MSPFLIPGTEVSEKLNGVHGFMVERKIENKKNLIKRKKLKSQNVQNVQNFSSGSSNLIIEPHPEEYLQEQSRVVVEIDKVNQHKKEAFGKEERKEKQDFRDNFFNIDSSGSYSVSW